MSDIRPSSEAPTPPGPQPNPASLLSADHPATTGEGPRLDLRTVRAAVLRALFSGIAGAIACFCLGLGWSPTWPDVWFVTFQGFLGGTILGAVALVEAVCWPWPELSRKRILGVCAAVWALAAFLCWGAVLQSIYARDVVEGHASQVALQSVERSLRFMADQPWIFVAMFGLLGLPFALGSLARGCGLGVPEQVGVSVAALSPASGVFLLTSLTWGDDGAFCFGIACAAVVFLPIASWLGDALERRLSGARSAVRTRKRRLAWEISVACLVIGGPLAWLAAAGRVAARELNEESIRVLLRTAEDRLNEGDYAAALAACVNANELGLSPYKHPEASWLWEEAAFYTGGDPPWGSLNQGWGASLLQDPSARVWRARYRRKQGDLEGALEDLDFAEASLYQPAAWLADRAATHDALGNSAAAAKDRARLAELQRDFDPSLEAACEEE